MDVALPSIIAWAPSISCMKPAASVAFCAGWALRLKAAAKLCAVTRTPVWKRNVRPEFEVVRASVARNRVRLERPPE